MTIERTDLAAVAARGVLWTGGGQLLRQIIQIATSLVLVRLLAPDDFGLLGMAMFFIGFCQMFADFGVGSAIVQSRSEDDVVLSSCFWLNLAIGAALGLLVAACSPWIGEFYRRSDLVPLVAVLSLNLVLAGLQVVPGAVLYRDLRFAELSRAQVLGSASGAVGALVLAALGAGVWALVAQPLIGSSVNLLACLTSSRWRPRWSFSWPRVAPLARFSTALLGTTVAGYANRNLDTLLVGRFLGAGPLGQYSMALQLMLYPLQQVSSVFVRVLFPALTQLKDDLPRLRHMYLKAVGAIALVTFPLMIGLFALAHDFVLVVFGPDWMDMVPVLRVLAWVGMMQSIVTTVGSIYVSMGRPGQALRVTLTAAPVLALGIAAGLPWGLFGVAVGYALANIVVWGYSVTLALRLIALRRLDFFFALARPLAASLAMLAVVLAAAPATRLLDAPGRLAAGVFCGIAAYAAATLIGNRRQVMELVTLVRSLRRGR